MDSALTLWGLEGIVSTGPNASRSSIASLSNGGFAVVYNDTLPGGQYDIYGQIFDYLGNSNGVNFVSDQSSIDKNIRSPHVVQLKSGSLAVTYSYEFSQTDGDIYSTIGSAPTFVTGASNTIDASSAYDDRSVYEAEKTQDGGFVTLWQREVTSTGEDQIVFQKVSSTGSLVGSQVVIGSGSAQILVDTGDITVLRNGNTVVSWREFDLNSSSSTQNFQIFNSRGVSLSGKFAFGDTPNAAFAQVEALSNGNFVAVWQDVTDGGVYHQVFNSNGYALSDPNFYNVEYGILPKATELSDGGYILAWSDYGGTESDGSPDGSITIQRFDASGLIVGESLIIDNPGDQDLQDIQTLADGRVIITYLSETGDSTDVNTLNYQIIDPRSDQIDGTAASDTIVGRSGDTTINGKDGDDRLVGLSGDDTLNGGSGNDNLSGGDGSDNLQGGSGNDSLDGEDGADVMQGGSGNDTYYVDTADDRIVEAPGSGTDTVVSAFSYVLAGGQSIETLTTANIDGSASINLTGNEFAQTIRGNDGTNRLDGGGGADTLIGGRGDDTYLVDSTGDRVSETAGGGRDAVATSVSYTLTAGQEIEELRVLLSVGDRAIDLTGNSLAQTLIGNNGTNILNGAWGSDVLTGRGGADTFVFANALGSNNVDRITDFAGVDTMQLSRSIFTALAPGELNVNAFKNLSTGTADGDDRILYQQTTGELFYDADGSGSGARVKFAVLDNKAALTAADFFVV